MIHKITAKQWDAMLAVHCTAPFRLIQAAAPVMRDAAKRELESNDFATQRCIINVSSTSGTHGNAGQANYSTVYDITLMSTLLSIYRGHHIGVGSRALQLVDLGGGDPQVLWER